MGDQFVANIIFILEIEIKGSLSYSRCFYNIRYRGLGNAFGGKEMVKYDLEIRKVIELLKEYNK